MLRLLPVLLAALLAAPAAQAQPAVCPDARAAERAARQAIAARPAETRHLDDCPPLGVTLTRWRDRHGVARRLRLEQGSGDSLVTTDHFYDAQGRLRAVAIRAGAVNGTVIRQHIAFDAAGMRRCEARRRLAGPGYTFPLPWPEEAILRDPARAFTASGRCGALGGVP